MRCLTPPRQAEQWDRPNYAFLWGCISSWTASRRLRRVAPSSTVRWPCRSWRSRCSMRRTWCFPLVIDEFEVQIWNMKLLKFRDIFETTWNVAIKYLYSPTWPCSIDLAKLDSRPPVSSLLYKTLSFLVAGLSGLLTVWSEDSEIGSLDMRAKLVYSVSNSL